MKLPAFWQHLPEEIRQRFGQKSAGKQRAMVCDGHLLLVLHEPPEPGSHERNAVFFWRKPDGHWDSSTGGGLLALKQHLDQYEQAESRLTDEYEHAQTAEDYFELLEKAGPLQHSTRNLHAALQCAREAFPHDRDLIDLRDWAYELERTFELLFAGSKNALDYRIARQAETQARLGNEALHVANRLNVLASIFFPLTAMASIFGMNLQDGFQQASTWQFWLVLLAGVVLGVSISWWVTRGRPLRRSRGGS